MNRKYRDEWREVDSVSRSAGWRAFIWIAAILVGAAILTAGVIAVKTATSDVRGEAEMVQKVNDADNRIQSQELFEKLYAKVLEYDANLDVAAAAVKRNPSSFNQTNYDGLVMTCNQAVTQYNAETRKVGSAKWRAKDLPYEIDTTDPKTDCRESFAK